MGRLSLTVVCLLVLTAARAQAQECSCGPTTVVPAWGAREVPVNARIERMGLGLDGARLVDGDLEHSLDAPPALAAWPAGPFIGGSRTELIDFSQLMTGPLRPDHAYTLIDASDETITEFTTSSVEDDQPPAAPVVRRLRLVVPEAGRGGGLVDIDLDAAFDPDVAFVVFLVQTEHGEWWAKARPDEVRWLGRRACGTQLPALRAGEHVRVRLTAADGAGNISVPVERELVVEVGAPAEPGCAPAPASHMRCGLGPTVTVIAGLALGAIALIVFGMWGIVQMCCFGGVRRAPVEGEAISLLVAERLARRVQRRGGLITILAIIAGVPWFVYTEHGFLVIASTVVGVIGVRSLVMARAMLRLIETGSSALSAEATEQTITVTLAHEVASIDVHACELDRARRHAVPTSIAKR